MDRALQSGTAMAEKIFEDLIGAGEFKARCLALLDHVAETGEPLIVTKRGRPVAKVVPVDPQERSPLLGSVYTATNLLEPMDTPWTADR